MSCTCIQMHVQTEAVCLSCHVTMPREGVQACRMGTRCWGEKAGLWLWEVQHSEKNKIKWDQIIHMCMCVHTEKCPPLNDNLCPSWFFWASKGEAGCSTKLPREKKVFVEQLYGRKGIPTEGTSTAAQTRLNISYENSKEIPALGIKYSNLISSSRYCSC